MRHSCAVCNVQVHHMLQQLPGGPNESEAVQEWLNQRSSTLKQIDVLDSKCVYRPSPPQYIDLQKDVVAFCSGLGQVDRLKAIAAGLLSHVGVYDSHATTEEQQQGSSAAVQEARMWLTSATAWSEQLACRFPAYTDIVQPVQLAVLEVCHGLALMVAAAEVQAIQSTGSSHRQSADGNLAGVVGGLLAFPTPIKQTTMTPAAAPGHYPAAALVPHTRTSPSTLALPSTQSITEVLMHSAASQQRRLDKPAAAAPSAAAADLTAYTWQMRSLRVALHVAVQELLLAGLPSLSNNQRNALNKGEAASAVPVSGLAAVHSVFDQLLKAWQQVKEFEAHEAEAAAQLYKHKTHTSTFLTDEVSCHL